jgi:hypothetical protein
MGAATSGVGDALDYGAGSLISDHSNPLLMNYAVWTQAFFKDGTKTGVLFLSKKYRDYKDFKFSTIFNAGISNVGLQYFFLLQGVMSRN